MRALFAVALLFAFSALAQDEAPPSPAPAPSPSPPARPAPAPPLRVGDLQKQANEGPKPQAPTPEQEVSQVAQQLFSAIIDGDAREVAQLCALPFYVEGRRFDDPQALLGEWQKNLRDKRTDLLTLYGVEVLTPDQMEKKYGKPPARLASWPWRGAHTYLAVGNLSGHAAVVVVKEVSPHDLRAVGFHD